MAVVGAGPAGLSQLHAFAAASQAGTAIPEIVCFEKQPTCGGMWNYADHTGHDEYGEPIHASMYRDLWSNGPKECIEFPDYTFDQHFGRAVPSYLPREELLGYLTARAARDNLGQFVRTSTVVEQITPEPEGSRFLVRSRHLPTGVAQTRPFDWIVVATGHFSTPNLPDIVGLAEFPGRVMHTHDLRDISELRGQRVLLVGAGDSAEDIAVQAYKYGASEVTISHRTSPLGYPWPQGIREAPRVAWINGRTAHMVDGQSVSVDTIILCTGYRHVFPFLHPSLQIETRNRLVPDGLYRGALLAHEPRIAYLGMQYPYYTFTMFEAQTWYVRDLILGRQTLPPANERVSDIVRWQAREAAAVAAGVDAELDLQTAYVADLLAATDYPPIDLAGIAGCFRQVEEDKAHNLLTYRDQVMTSVITGTRAAAPARPWLETFPATGQEGGR